MNRLTIGVVTALLLAAFLLPVRATETENADFRMLPPPQTVTVDGKVDDWDLSAGLFACADVESAASTYAVWLHAMWDAASIVAVWLRWSWLRRLRTTGGARPPSRRR